MLEHLNITQNMAAQTAQPVQQQQQQPAQQGQQRGVFVSRYALNRNW